MISVFDIGDSGSFLFQVISYETEIIFLCSSLTFLPIEGHLQPY